MKKHLKLLAIVLSVILCFTAFSLTVAAVDSDGDGYDDITGELIGGDSSMVEPEPTDAPYTEPDYTDAPYTEPDYTEPDYTDAPYTEPDYTDAPYTEPDYTEATDEPSYEESSDYESESSDDYYSIPDPPSYVGGGQSYVAPESTAPSVPLIETNEDIDVNELSSNDWKEISANLKNADNSTDGDDFSFIQKNTSAGDNGHWMLILGVVLVLLSLAGITYFFVSGAMTRKKLASAGSQSKGGSQDRYRSNDDYDDGFKTSHREEKKKAKRSSRYDTAEVTLPKNKNRYRKD